MLCLTYVDLALAVFQFLVCIMHRHWHIYIIYTLTIVLSTILLCCSSHDMSNCFQEFIFICVHLSSGELSSKRVRSDGKVTISTVFVNLEENSHYCAHVLSLGRIHGNAMLYFATKGIKSMILLWFDEYDHQNINLL